MHYFLSAPHLGQSASERVAIIMKLQEAKKPQQVAKDLDQWVKKLKCSGTSGVGMESFADIRVGIDNSPVIGDSIKYDPITEEDIKNITSKAMNNENVTIELASGLTFTGSFKNGLRDGKCQINSMENV